MLNTILFIGLFHLKIKILFYLQIYLILYLILEFIFINGLGRDLSFI